MKQVHRCHVLLLAAVLTVSLYGQEGPAAAVSFEDTVRLASQARESGRVEEAITFYRKALSVKPDWEEGSWYLGTLLFSADRAAEALAPLRSVLSTHPKNGAAWAFKGMCEFELRQYDPAIKSLENARAYGVGDNPGLVTLTRYTLAILLNRARRFDNARAELNALVEHGHSERQIIQALGCSVLLLPDLPSEIQAGETEPVMLAGQAAAAAVLKQLPEAARSYEKLVELYPRKPNVHYAYGVFLAGDQEDKSIAEFRQEIALTPSHVPARLQLVGAYLRMHDEPQAHQLAEEAVKILPSWYLTHQMLGRTLLETGDTRGAIAELEKAQDLGPDDPQNQFHLARAYKSAGREADAAKARQEFLRLNQVDSVH